MAPVILEPKSILLQGWWLWLTLLGLRFPSVKRESHITDVSWALIAYLSTGVGFPPSLQMQAQATPLGWLYPPLWVWLFSVTFREEIYPERAILWLMSQATQLIPHHSFSYVSSAYILSPHWETVGELPSLPLLPSSIYAGSLSGSPQRLTLWDLIQSQSFTPGSSYEKPGGRSKQRAKRNTPKPTEWALALCPPPLRHQTKVGSAGLHLRGWWPWSASLV